ncbi:uncharacterized protein LOC142589918 [Dermacentor variabilis]|uniref:uncharacterized protein LOC142589918 n=1 Tax=Dermacentor variabilis TaxID=34621 RepID=UPI003F5BB499
MPCDREQSDSERALDDLASGKAAFLGNTGVAVPVRIVYVGGSGPASCVQRRCAVICTSTRVAARVAAASLVTPLVVVLIHRKGDKSDRRYWRPIALGNTAAKFYAKCLGGRLQDWLGEHSILSPCQKGFLPHGGVFQHNFVLQERLDKAHSGDGDVCVAFLDFTNAYGSIPHQALLYALRRAGTGNRFVDLIADLYTDSRTRIVAILAAIRQGCPLSGLLFNLVVDPIIPDIQGGDRPHNILAYADDLTPLAASLVALQARIKSIEALASEIGLALNSAKCRSLYRSGVHPVGTRPWSFTVAGAPIPAMTDFGAQKFLGRPVGFRIRLRHHHRPGHSTGYSAANIFAGPFVAVGRGPGLNFMMRYGTLGKDNWQRLDDVLPPLRKRTLYFPNKRVERIPIREPTVASSCHTTRCRTLRSLPHRQCLYVTDVQGPRTSRYGVAGPVRGSLQASSPVDRAKGRRGLLQRVHGGRLPGAGFATSFRLDGSTQGVPPWRTGSGTQCVDGPRYCCGGPRPRGCCVM